MKSTERRNPHYLKPTAASLAKQEPPVKQEKKGVSPNGPMRKRSMAIDDPDRPAPASASTAPERVQGGVAGKDEKRVPLYLATTASMKAKTLPTKKWIKRESRLPPRMVLRKRSISSETSEEEKKASSAPGKSISTSPERVSSEALKKEGEEKKATLVISSVYRSILME